MKVIDVPASSGFRWIKLAWNNHFKKAPLAWMGLMAVWFVVSFGMLIIPVVGQVAASILQPVFFAGFMLACRTQEQGEMLQVSGIFSALRSGNVRPLLIVGCVLLAGQFLIVMGITALGLPELTLTADGKNIDVEAFRTGMQGKEWLIFLFIGLTALLKGALWFVPPLLAFHDMKASHAMRWSVYAFLSNFTALLVYGAIIVVIYLLALLPYGLGLLIAVPVVAISNYTGYSAMFVEDGEKVEKVEGADKAETP